VDKLRRNWGAWFTIMWRQLKFPKIEDF